MVKQPEATKVYTRRDSATAALKKLGVKQADYNKFITQADGKFVCLLAAASEHLEPPKKSQATVKAATRVTVAGVVRGLVTAGKTNEEIWAIIQPQFRLRDDQRHYPGWYRNQQTRKKRNGTK